MSNSGSRLLIVLGLFVLGQPAMADDDENYKRLAAMPRERRVALAENLERFDKLEPAQQAEIRRLDLELSKKADQARYRAVLRSYHLWVASLSQEKQEKLRDAKTSEERFNLASKFRAEEKESTSKPLPRVMGVRTGDFGMVGPYEAAHLLKVWQELTPLRQAAIAKKSDRVQILKEIRTEGQALKIHGPTFRAEDEAEFGEKFRHHPEFSGLLNSLALRADTYRSAMEKEHSAAMKKGDGAGAKKITVPRKFEHPFAEFLYYEEHRPHLVLHKDLDRFIASVPAWFLEVLDPLCPDDARYFLTIVYRLRYPAGQEMPDESKVKSDASKPAQAAKAKSSGKPGSVPESN